MCVGGGGVRACERERESISLLHNKISKIYDDKHSLPSPPRLGLSFSNAAVNTSL